MLLPMLGVYQEYVRNHHYSLQVLAEYKMKEEFNRTLKRCEDKSQCEGRSIESFLTCPMYQVSSVELLKSDISNFKLMYINLGPNVLFEIKIGAIKLVNVRIYFKV